MDRPKANARTILFSLAPLVGLGLLLEAGLIAIILVALRTPDTLNNLYGYSPATLAFFLQGWGLPRPLPLSAPAFQWSFGGLWLGLHLVWLLAIRWAARGNSSRSTLGVVLGLGLLFNLTLALAMPPLFSTDILNYLAYGRMAAFHGLNPYTTLPAAMSGDPLLALPFWNIVCPYGPLWSGAGTLVASLAGYGGVMAGVLLLKGLAGLAHLVLAGLLYALASADPAPAGSGLAPATVALAVAWSPLFLLEGAGQGHNDLVMLVLAVAGLLAFRRNRPWIGYLLLLLSVLVKYVSLLLVAYVLVTWLRRQAGGRERAILLGKVALLSGVVVLAALLPFWTSPQAVLTALLGETTRIRASPAALLLIGVEQVLAAWPATAARALPLATTVTQVLLKGVLAVLVIAQGLALWRRAAESWAPPRQAWERTALVYICFLHGATFPWYFTWPAATVLLDGPRQGQRALAALTFGLGAFGGLLYGIPI